MVRLVNFLVLFLTFGNVQLFNITMTNPDEYTYITQEDVTLDDLFGSYTMPISDPTAVDTSMFTTTPTSQQLQDWYDVYEVAYATDQHAYTWEVNEPTDPDDVSGIILIMVYGAMWYIVIRGMRWLISF